MHAGKLWQVTNFTIVGGTAKHCVDQYMVLFRCCSLGGDAAMPGRLHARLCHAFLARDVIYTSRAYAMMPVRLSVCLSVT